MPHAPHDPGTAVVLGAAGGIGAACARLLAGRNVPVVAVDRSPAVAGLADCRPVTGDVTDPAVLDAAFAACPAPATILVHAVLAEARRPLDQLTAADWHRVFDAGLLSAWQAAVRLRASAQRRASSIVLIGSVHGRGALPGFGAYATVKAALPALARAIAAEWAADHVRCNVLEPGFVAVPRNKDRWSDPGEADRILAAYPAGRLCQPEEIASVVAFLADGASSYVNGTTITVDGGALAVLPEANIR